ncbi:hypothetical protein SPI_07076 [Niveomyces insectorum RCEF 264]|uniref:Uncharacterized protein n=1 Tax=Niveomyces insectorum RCEF 264 TaxID=1081102 RepID=A0A167Q916_9HYPO|nr:hypothetical protein SPI_07076 [Niveomyces insectorum RCEF 264]
MRAAAGWLCRLALIRWAMATSTTAAPRPPHLPNVLATGLLAGLPPTRTGNSNGNGNGNGNGNAPRTPAATVCRGLATSLFSHAPTVPPAILSFEASWLMTATACQEVAPPPSLSADWASYTNDVSAWLAVHSVAYTSFLAACQPIALAGSDECPNVAGTRAPPSSFPSSSLSSPSSPLSSSSSLSPSSASSSNAPGHQQQHQQPKPTGTGANGGGLVLTTSTATVTLSGGDGSSRPGTGVAAAGPGSASLASRSPRLGDLLTGAALQIGMVTFFIRAHVVGFF